MTNLSIKIDISKGNEIHQLKIHLPDNEEDQKNIRQYRYDIYHKNGYLKLNPDRLDLDCYDSHSLQLIASFDDQIVGSLRIIQGDTIPTLDHYYLTGLPPILTDTPKRDLIEVGRIISTPHLVTDFVPRHFVLLAMFYYVSEFAKQNGLDLIIGTMKQKVVDKIKKIKFPIHDINDVKFNPEAISPDDPFFDFFDENKTGKFCPVYVRPSEGTPYLDSIFNQPFIFKKLGDDHFALKSAFLYKVLILSKLLFK